MTRTHVGEELTGMKEPFERASHPLQGHMTGSHDTLITGRKKEGSSEPELPALRPGLLITTDQEKVATLHVFLSSLLSSPPTPAFA